MSRRRGRFLVLEGLDGAGTTTQVRLLAEALRRRGRRVHLTAEPSGGPAGSLVRQVLARRLGGVGGGPLDAGALALLFAADRLDHWASEIAPRLGSGADVVCDRYALSSLAYQSLTTGAPAWVEAVNRRAPAPDLTVFLRVRPAVAMRRRLAESGRPELYEVAAFQRRVAGSYRRSIVRMRRLGQRVAAVDGEGAVEAVAARVLAAVERLG
ncbi:MAG TPA: dTMP kinase [Anaeromyxobacteraceae bacterium]|jgi:dTMP kinase